MSKDFRVVFLGTPEFAVPALKKLIATTDVLAVYSKPDKPVGRGLKLQSSPVKQLAMEHSIPVYTPEKISTPEEVERIKQLNPDFIVVVAYGQILKNSIIEIPKFGCINIHSSLLPRWRGAAPIHWALWSGDSETGITTMRIVQKLDAGDILLQKKIPIKNTDTVTSLHDQLANLGSDLIEETLNQLKAKTLTGVVQDDSLVTYAHKLTKEMGILDGQQTSTEVDLAVRTLNPWPGVLIETVEGRKYKIKSGRPKIGMNRKEAGVLFTEAGDLYLQCSSGAYQIEEIQEEGKKAVKIPDFLNGLQSKSIALPFNIKKKEMIL
jgi:methionyl-tRNA formyltransferase